MSDRSIIFQGPMVRGLLREIEHPGTGKTQTRRILRGAWQEALEGHDEVLTWFAPPHVPAEGIPNQWAESGIWARRHGPRGYNRHLGYVPHRPGDRLWVRETVACGACAPSPPATWSPAFWRREQGTAANPNGLWYAADGLAPEKQITKRGRWKASIHMPRWASRITLLVTGVKVERLQDISEEDALSEGCPARTYEELAGEDPRGWFADLWDGINGPGAWEANPWVAAYSFAPRLGNIDALPARLAEAAYV